MSQPQGTVLNGPSGELTMAFKDAQPQNPELMNKFGSPATLSGSQRPQLQRNDSRANLQQQRPILPQNQNQFRPPPIRPQLPPGSPLPQFRPGTPPQRPTTPLNQAPQVRLGAARPPNPVLRPPQPPQPPQPRPAQKPLAAQNLDSVETENVVGPEEKSTVEWVQEERPPPRPESRASLKEPDEKDKKANPPSNLPINGHSVQPEPTKVIEDIGKPPKTPEPSKLSKSKPTAKKEGDNDSGVDESIPGNDHSTNGEHSPRKSARSSRLATPTKNRSFSRGSMSPGLKSPDSMPTTPGGTEKKKIPMNKIQVGAAPSPNLKVVKSKIGSLANSSYKPGGGNVKIENRKIDVSHAQSKIGAKNETYTPTGGDKKIVTQKLQWSARSKIGSLENATHKPKGGDKKIETVKLDFKDKAKSKVGSKDNIKHQPGGGEVKSDTREYKIGTERKNIENRKLNIKVESKVGSLDNVKHKPGGGDKKIFDDKEYLRQMSGMSNENNSMSGSQNSLPSQPSDAREPVSDENLNREH